MSGSLLFWARRAIPVAPQRWKSVDLAPVETTERPPLTRAAFSYLAGGLSLLAVPFLYHIGSTPLPDCLRPSEGIQVRFGGVSRTLPGIANKPAGNSYGLPEIECGYFPAARSLRKTA